MAMGDVVTLSLESPTLDIKTYTLTYDGENWNADTEVIFTYMQNETITATATYAPQGTAGTVEYLVGECGVNEGKIEVNFTVRNYSRLRIATIAGQTLTVTTTGFTPIGATEEATEAFTLTANEKGNAYLYGIFAEGATTIVKFNDATLAERTFETATEPAKGYAPKQERQSHACRVHEGRGL